MFTIQSVSEEGVYYLLPTKYSKYWIKPEQAWRYDFYKTPAQAKAALTKRLKDWFFGEEYGNDTFSVVEIKRGF